MSGYLRDPEAITRLSFERVRAVVNLDDLPAEMAPVAVRMVHACGMADVIGLLAYSAGAASAGRRALERGAAVICDGEMTKAGVSASRLPARNRVICTIAAPGLGRRARAHATTRSAAAVDLWRDDLGGAVVAIGTAPTALFRLLELLDEGAPAPALVVAMPVGFVGAAESKDALIARGGAPPYIAVRGRRGGSALAAAAVNALAAGDRA
jgi:precorrin-8X/cobalt-precorrin-8 methylmutase